MRMKVCLLALSVFLSACDPAMIEQMKAQSIQQASAPAAPAQMSADSGVASYPVPGTGLSIATLTRGGEVSVCAPGDQAITVTGQSSAWISVGTQDIECLAFNRETDSTLRYKPVPLPFNSVPQDMSGHAGNPYLAVQGVQYFVDQQSQYWGLEPLPVAILPDGRSCDHGIALPAAANPHKFISKTVIKCLVFNQNADGVTAEMVDPH